MGDWVWDGGRPSLDLLNTVRDRVNRPRDTLRTPADLSAWLAEAGLPAGPGAGPDALAAARRLRAAIDALAFPGTAADGLASDVWPPGTGAGPDALAADVAVSVVNAAAADAPPGPRLTLSGGHPVALTPEPSPASALGLVAVDTIDLLTGHERLRVCAAGDCGIRFADRSPARNRQWCSMRRCGNRTKARRHYARS